MECEPRMYNNNIIIWSLYINVKIWNFPHRQQLCKVMVPMLNNELKLTVNLSKSADTFHTVIS